MNKLFKKQTTVYKNKIDFWANSHHLQLVVFNLVIILFFLLRSAGYFQPFYTLSVNFIILLGLVISIPLLNFGSRAMFIISIVFLLFTGLLKLLAIDVWAERSAIYVYQPLVIGLLLLIYEEIGFSNK